MRILDQSTPFAGSGRERSRVLSQVLPRERCGRGHSVLAIRAVDPLAVEQFCHICICELSVGSACSFSSKCLPCLLCAIDKFVYNSHFICVLNCLNSAAWLRSSGRMPGVLQQRLYSNRDWHSKDLAAFGWETGTLGRGRGVGKYILYVYVHYGAWGLRCCPRFA